ncbi:hypothetical protein SODALDRAFT_51214 [Sodiomyces alkalinus F11]|uniref:DUF7785 domain-containing protein n=1 Tax=Sodiomyces alkalinus (strain CBS 110278 / VKM F-3762 / F11) TaxID=1314773 RepID=A0A3N2PMN5_SODAK|nr:hypothetical protein SODALDRAFT_51214 [Sodiomyces alkalinus F11]ROT35785.1 hypothetical protein SODALDRAFT_51214 [Sodiomyces alkalinus F11]
MDVVAVVEEQLEELKSASRKDGPRPNKKTQEAILAITRFKEKALEILRREMIYPRTAFDPMQKMSYDTAAGSANQGNTILTVFGKTPQGRPLFSSLPRSVTHPDEKHVALKQPSEFILPSIIKTTRLVPTRQMERSRTLGEVFGPTRPLLPLQPPKQPKPQTKGNVLGFSHPQLVERSSYRSPSYFSQKLSVGYYIDYSNTTSPTATRATVHHKRAQSLAGHKPSTSELEVAEMESLFRGAFSSFAPCKNDAGAVVPASLASRVHWYKAGQRDFNRMIEEVERKVEDVTESEKTPVPEPMEVNEDIIEDVIKNWDPALVDPALNNVMCKPKSDEEKEADELLDEVSDMIVTLASHQRIRHLSLPSSQNRYSADPANSDMLANSTGPSPSEDETAAYDVLKAQLALIIKTLPPYAVAKLDGDQLNELLVDTKMEVHTEQSKGLLDDESATQARARQQQQAAVTATAASRSTGHRTSNAPTYGAQFAPANQYGTPTRPPVPQQTFYRQGQTPIQQPQPQPQPHTVPRPGAPHAIAPQPYRPQLSQAHRPANGYANHYVPQLAKSQTPYGHHGSPQYTAQQRPPQYHPYGASTPQHNSPAPRYQAGYGQGYQAQPGTPTPGNYGGYPNGTPTIQPRPMSPQVRAGQYSPSPPLPQQARPAQHAQPHQPLSQHPHPHHQQHPQMQAQRQRQYAAPHQNMPGTPINRQQYATNGAHQVPPGSLAQGPTGYMTSTPDQNHHHQQQHQQQQRLMEQARARAAAQQNSVSFGDKLSQGGPVAGMAGMGVGNYDGAQYAAQRARMVGGTGPKPQSPVNAGNLARPGLNGTPLMQQAPPTPLPGTPQQNHHQQSQVQQQPTQMPQQAVAHVQQPH